MASIGSEDGDVGFQIAPMVDVVFVLMLFFMASAGSIVVEKELSIKLPGTPREAMGAPPIPINIQIDPDGTVNMNNTVYAQAASRDLSGLEAKLTDLVAAGSEDNPDPVIIAPDADSTHERVIDVLNVAAAAGVTNLSFK